MILNLFRAENLPGMMSVWLIYYKLWIFVIVNYPYHQQHRVLCLLKSVSTRFFVHAEKYDYKLFIFLLFTSFASFFSFSSRFRYQIARIIITFCGLLIWLIFGRSSSTVRFLRLLFQLMNRQLRWKLAFLPALNKKSTYAT